MHGHVPIIGSRNAVVSACFALKNSINDISWYPTRLREIGCGEPDENTVKLIETAEVNPGGEYNA